MFWFYVIVTGILLNVIAPILPGSPFVKYQDLPEKSRTVRTVLTFIPFSLIITYFVLTKTDQTSGGKVEKNDPSR